MNAMCKVIIIKVLQRIFGLWFHEITHICNIYLLNPASLANQEMLISTMILVWNGSKNYSNWGVIIFHPIWAFFPIRICRKTLILGPRWFAKSSGYVPFSCQKSIKCLINNKGHCPLITFWLCPLHSWQVHQPLKDWQKCWPKLGLLCSISMTTLTVSVQSNQGSLNIQPSIPCWLKIANKFKL